LTADPAETSFFVVDIIGMLEMPLVAVSRRKHYEEVADQLERTIYDGEYAPPDQLPSGRELAREFGVCRPAIREARFRLRKTGLVEIRSGERAGGRSRSLKWSSMPSPAALIEQRRTTLALGEGRPTRLPVDLRGGGRPRPSPGRTGAVDHSLHVARRYADVVKGPGMTAAGRSV
jgi:DNA-binding transcriptional MocR family regulator